MNSGDKLRAIMDNQKLYNEFERQLSNQRIYATSKGCYFDKKKVGTQEYGNKLKAIAASVYDNNKSK